MKLYVQNLLSNNEKRVMDVEDHNIAAEIFVRDLLLNNGETDPIVVVSKGGFYRDLYKFDMIDEVDNSISFSTYNVIQTLADNEEDKELRCWLYQAANKLRQITNSMVEELDKVNAPLAESIRSLASMS